MFAVSALVFVFGIGDFIARAAEIDKVDRLLRKPWPVAIGQFSRRPDRRGQRVEDNAFHLHTRAAAACVTRVSHWSSFRLDFVDSSAAFYFHDLVAQQRGPLEFEICGSLLHFLLKFAQKLSQIEIAASFADDRGLDFASTQNR